jgi:hypothetical protein
LTTESEGDLEKITYENSNLMKLIGKVRAGVPQASFIRKNKSYVNQNPKIYNNYQMRNTTADMK